MRLAEEARMERLRQQEEEEQKRLAEEAKFERIR
jgi:hypothetical protein